MIITLRPATADDLMSVGALHQRSRVSAYRPFLPREALAEPTAEMLGRYWVERWSHERDSHLLTVAEQDAQLAGFTYLGPEETDPDTGLLCAIHLDPDRQGRGIGRALMIDALATLHRRGWRRANLWVLRDNGRARRFYERGGWVADGVERDEHFGPVTVRQLRYTRALP
ncbi:GNAT family N-acetyltransferase [Micromonospora echinofusca]|uniref:GNAT family N-acetyltransferase n=1 Tax=Micromonospora echinofusca TaxID=47858 RepID=A0ABS3VYP1_MICEH|nr:GNAT family N-acetyltransferase [Micromonospora echinofusca]MBO4209660.1 GNAT family N-acetyltransferase [Micromonospora echinofusca]